MQVTQRARVQSLGRGRYPWRRKWQPTPVFSPGKSTDKGTQQAAVHRVTKSRTHLNIEHTQTPNWYPIQTDYKGYALFHQPPPLLLFFWSKSFLLAEELLFPDSKHMDPVGAASYSKLASGATEACLQIYGGIVHSWLCNWPLRQDQDQRKASQSCRPEALPIKAGMGPWGGSQREDEALFPSDMTLCGCEDVNFFFYTNELNFFSEILFCQLIETKSQ